MNKAELIFVPAPAIGHLVSTLEFAKRLIDCDDRLSITILCPKIPFMPFTDTYPKTVLASQPRNRIQLIDLREIDPPPLELSKKSPEKYMCVLIESLIPTVKAIIQSILSSHSNSNSTRIVGLVLDLCCLSMIDMGNELGIPSYMFQTTNAGFLGLMLYLSTGHNQTSTVFKESDHALSIPGFVNPFPQSALPTALFNNDGGYTAYIKLAKRYRDIKGIIVNSFSELESYAIGSVFNGHVPPVYAVGPVIDIKGPPHPNLDQAQHENIMKWLDDQPSSSVVFLCFGSMGSFGSSQVREIALGIQGSGYKFLWAMRMSPITKENPLNMLPEGFLEWMKDRGMLCEWAPQVEVLAHKAIGGFVSHCGWNSILESLWFGVPIVTWPMYAEQPLNAFMMVKELGLAVELRLDYRMGVDLVMADEIEKAVKHLMDFDCEVRKKVKEMGEMARKAVLRGGSSFNAIGQFIEDVIGSSSC
ncbi:Glycosyltransferase [Quillaja saponaria]|uniref:Glycosyltransferase n=1 Tax=Quillaja saponaria TaxID=32244 RepID=A0AAD7LTY4_QUISA|nr:Glycosyltransferase [Quillaja saponaria]